MRSARRTFLRDLEVGPLLDLILVMAVLCVLLIRFWLHLTGCPRVGGIGFGLFIDEVGKFITKDNDYFYEPAVSVIYVVFVLLYLAGRSLVRREKANPAENIVNALRSALTHSTAAEDRRNGMLEGLLRRAVATYRRVAASRWFGWSLVAFFALQLAAAGLRLVLILPWFAPRTVYLADIPLVPPPPSDPERFVVADWLQLFSGLVAGGFVALGLLVVFRDRLRALRMFLRATVVTLCLTQAFLFYRVEWLGLGALAVSLMVLAGLRFAVDHERTGTTA